MIRLAEAADLPLITAIYNEAVAERCCGDLSPVTVESRQSWFSEHARERHPIFVAISEWGEVVGWSSFSPYRKGRAAFRHTAEISYYVASAHRRKGIATSLLNHSKSKCADLGIRTIFAIVLEHNTPSRHLLDRSGFAVWGFLPGVADFHDFECGHYYYGLKFESPDRSPTP